MPLLSFNFLELNYYDKRTIDNLSSFVYFEKSNLDSNFFSLQYEMQKLVEGNVPRESSGGEDTKHHPLLLQVMYFLLITLRGAKHSHLLNINPWIPKYVLVCTLYLMYVGFIFLQMIAREANCEVGEICDFELQLCDTQPSVVAGAMKEFIFSGRLDNLCMSFCSLKVCSPFKFLHVDCGDQICIFHMF